MRLFVASIGGALLVAFCVTAPARAGLTDAPSMSAVIGAAAAGDGALAALMPRVMPRVTIAAAGEPPKDKPPEDRRDEGQLVNNLHDIFEALGACWIPPPPEKSRPGMEYTVMFAFKRDGELIAPARVTYSTHGVPEDVRNVYHEAIEAAFRRCTPMHFSTGMAGAIAGRPLSFHIFDNRIMIEQFKNDDQGTKKDSIHALPGEDDKSK